MQSFFSLPHFSLNVPWITSSPQEERLLSYTTRIHSTAQPFPWLRTPASPSAHESGIKACSLQIMKTFSSVGLFTSQELSTTKGSKKQVGSSLKTQKVMKADYPLFASTVWNAGPALAPACSSSAAVGALTWGNASPKRLQGTTEAIAETLPWRNEICNKAVSPHSLCALFEDVKRSKEGTLATWGLTSGGYWSTSPLRDNCQSMDQNGWEISVQGMARSRKHYQESAAKDWERLLEQGKTLQGKVISPQHPSWHTFGGQESKRMRLGQNHSFWEKWKRNCKGLRGSESRWQNNLMYPEIRKAQSLNASSRSSNAYDVSLK